MATKAEIVKLWAVLCATYPQYSKDLQPDTLELTVSVYQELLADIPIATLQASAKQHIASSKWFPTVAELRQGATSISTTQHVTALEAWGEVKAAMLAWNRYSNGGDPAWPTFSNPLIANMVRNLGGMIALQDSENEVADRARFVEGYNVLLRRAEDDKMLLPGTRELRQQIAAGNGAPQLTDGNGARRVGDVLAGLLPRSAKA
jgi:hypothetical protein